MMAKRKEKRETRRASGTLARILRVDHAGEYGAVRIYEGQSAILRHRAEFSPSAARIEAMREEEEAHLAAFEDLLRERGARPSALLPLWHVAGFALGAATALMGEKHAMACTMAVEDVIGDHYGSQIVELEERGEEVRLRRRLAEFRAAEMDHGREAAHAGGGEALGYRALSSFVRMGCRAAIFLSSHI